MNGYDVDAGYMGWVEKFKTYRLFSCYRDYREYVEAQEDPK